MPNLASELSTMDFDSLVASPLLAVINAQSQASLASAQFLINSAFDDPLNPGSLKMVEMTIDRWDPDSQTSQKVKIKVPLITMMNVPNMQVEEYDYGFLVKINSVDYKDTQSKFNVAAGLDFQARWGWGGVRLNVSAAYQKQTKQGSKVTRDYQMNIKVKALSNQMPGGTQILLETLQRAILEEPVN